MSDLVVRFCPAVARCRKVGKALLHASAGILNPGAGNEGVGWGGSPHSRDLGERIESIPHERHWARRGAGGGIVLVHAPLKEGIVFSQR